MLSTKKGSASAGLLLFLLVSGMVASEYLVSPDSLSGQATRGTRGGTRGAAPPPQISSPSLVVAPTCTDLLKNGQETDVDCGGPTCPKCSVPKTCLANSDCSTNSCVNNLCTSAVQLQQECVLGAGGPCNRNECGGSADIQCDGSCSGPAPIIPSNLGQACNRNQCGGTGTVKCDGTCSASAHLVPSNLGQACNRNQCGGSGTVKCDGTCSLEAPPLPSNLGQACNRNQCGGTGTTACDGTCSASAPFVPSNLGQPCNRNSCGGSGIIVCDGTCSASLPLVPSNLGQACNRNQCGGTGAVKCDGTCSAVAPSIPSNFGQACNRNQCGGSGSVKCDGTCSSFAPSVPSNYGQSCGCGGSVQCNGQCNKGGCSSDQRCDNGQCVSKCTGWTSFRTTNRKLRDLLSTSHLNLGNGCQPQYTSGAQAIQFWHCSSSNHVAVQGPVANDVQSSCNTNYMTLQVDPSRVRCMNLGGNGFNGRVSSRNGGGGYIWVDCELPGGSGILSSSTKVGGEYENYNYAWDAIFAEGVFQCCSG